MIHIGVFKKILKTSNFSHLRTIGAHRSLSLQEYIGMKMLKEVKIHVANGFLASSPEEAFKLASKHNFKDYIVKAQVLSGGRGKGHFKNGVGSGIQTARNPQHVKDITEMMIGNRLVTKQTGPSGLLCNHVYVCERYYPRREFYLAITLDRNTSGPILIGSAAGGVNIEETLSINPQALQGMTIDILEGIDRKKLMDFLRDIDFTSELIPLAVDQLVRAYDLAIANDITLLELNPFCETHDGQLFSMDCKIQIDDNSLFRHPHFAELRDYSQEKEADSLAEKAGINYICLDGNIACLVNGAGLAMATMDIIKLHGGSPANFLDIGGGATVEQVVTAFQIILSDKNVKAILVNIFGGIMRCDVIAEGIILAAEKIDINVPLVVRLQGTNEDEAKILFLESGMKIIALDDLEDASHMVVKLASIVELARQVNIDVKFELPI